MTRRPLLPLAVLAVLLLVPRVAGAESPLDAEQRRLGGEVITNAGRAGSMIPLIELWRAYERVDPAVTVAELERIAAARALPEHRRAYVRALLARATTRRGDVEAARRATADLGYVTAWQVVGPFDNEGRAGFDRAFGPEEARMAAFDSEATFEGKERQVGYRSYPDGIARHGYVDFDAVMRPFENVCGYATTTITSDRAQPLSLWVGAGGAVRVFWNGQEVHADPTYRSPDPDRTAIVVGAHRGPNRVLVKVCVAERTWGFYFRVGDARGGAARGVRVDASAMLVPPAGHGVTRLPTVRSSLAELEAAAAAEPPNARALEELARFLAYTGSDDPDENRARQLAVRAADLEPTVARLELAAMLTEQRGEAMRFIARAEQRFPNDPKTTLLRARLRRTSLNQ